METKSHLPVLILPVLLLFLLRLVMHRTDESGWSAGDFVIAWVLLTGVGLAYKLVTRRASPLAYRAGCGLALLTALALVWGNLAVGFIGGEDHPANLLYLGVLLVGAVGACLACFEAAGMARALFTTALAQALVPVVAMLVWRPDFGPGVVKVFLLNTVFALSFAGAGLLFRIAAGKGESKGGRDPKPAPAPTR